MKLVKLIHSFLDFFYPLFKRFFDKTTYYYAVCGVSNLVLSWFLFFIFYQFLFKKENWHFPLVNFTLSSYTMTAFLCFIISFSIGFTLLKYVVFTKSQLKGTTQLFRYAVSALITTTIHDAEIFASVGKKLKVSMNIFKSIQLVKLVIRALTA